MALTVTITICMYIYCILLGVCSVFLTFENGDLFLVMQVMSKGCRDVFLATACKSRPSNLII